MLIFGCGQLMSNDKAVSVEGLFTKGFETYELKTKSGERYHVFDPQHLLKPLIQAGIKNQIEEKLWLTISVCVEGQLSSKGNYGHLGAYRQQIELTGLCHYVAN